MSQSRPNSVNFPLFLFIFWTLFCQKWDSTHFCPYCGHQLALNNFRHSADPLLLSAPLLLHLRFNSLHYVLMHSTPNNMTLHPASRKGATILDDICVSWEGEICSRVSMSASYSSLSHIPCYGLNYCKAALTFQTHGYASTINITAFSRPPLTQVTASTKTFDSGTGVKPTDMHTASEV